MQRPRQILHVETWPQQRGVVADMLYRLRITLTHMGRCWVVPDPPRAAEVCADAVGTDQIGIECQNLVFGDLTWAAFLKPWIGTWARR